MTKNTNQMKGQTELNSPIYFSMYELELDGYDEHCSYKPSQPEVHQFTNLHELHFTKRI